MVLALILTFLKNVIYGASVFFTGELSSSVDVPDILALRFLMSFLVLFILKQTRILKINVGIRDLFRPTDRHKYIKSLLIAAIFEPVLYMLFETLGVSMTTGITAGVILTLSPISSCICEEIILKEKSTLLQKIFLGLGIIGVIYIAVNTGETDGKDTPLGILFIILAVVSGSLFLVFSRKSSVHFSSFEITYFSSALGAAAFNTINIVRHLVRGDILHYFDPYFDLQNMVGFVFLAVISTIVATSMNNYALSKIKVSTSS
ncbi:MAG: EamA family transporter, partial [Clostridia bacterium]|nr:EamA family transporter [Clostridia bacterium]